MKLPVPAPTLSDLFTSVESSSLPRILGRGINPEVNGVYEHWDKLRHRTPPSELTTREWWLGIKLARAGLAKPLPLVDKSGAAFRACITDTMQRLLHYVDREAAGAIQGMDGHGDVEQPQFLMRSLIEEAMTSSQLEGAATTSAVAKEMLSTGRQPRDHSERMIFNNYRAMREIKERGKVPFTPEGILEIHRILTDDTLDSVDCGRLRTGADNVVIYDKGSPPTLLHVPPSPDELPERLRHLCDFANDLDSERFLHPVVRAIAIHFQLGYDHPFCDGNGRTARTLFYWSMLNSGYWLTEYISISSVLKRSPGSYLRAYLYTESDEQDLGYFIAQQLSVIDKAIKSLHAYIARKGVENRRAQQLLRAASVMGQNFNHRQRNLLADAIHHPDRVYTVAGHQTTHRVTYPTALSDLSELTAAGLLHKHKVGKAYHFLPIADLNSRLLIDKTKNVG